MFREAEGSFFVPGVPSCVDSVGRLQDDVYEDYRPTVSIALMTGNQVLLVQSSKRQAGEPASWLLPQGGTERGETIYQAISRELEEELNLNFSETQLLSLEQNRMLRVVGWYVNESRLGELKPKLIIVVAMQVQWLGEIRLNAENVKHAFANGQHVLWQLMRGTRPRKFMGTLRALDEAHRRGLIGWSCRDVLDTLEADGVAA